MTPRAGLLRAEAQYLAGVDPFRYPSIEVYLPNGTDNQVEWKRALLNGAELRMLTNGIVWFQFYPAPKTPAGQTSVLQICLVSNPRADVSIEAETTDGRRIKAVLPRFRLPPHQITSLTFRRDLRKCFLAYEVSSSTVRDASARVPRKIAVNGVDVTARTVLIQTPSEQTGLAAAASQRAEDPEPAPGLVTLPLPSGFRLGAPVHVRLEFASGAIAQCIVRAHSGIFLDAFGVAENDLATRRRLGLDLRPFGRLRKPVFRCQPLSNLHIELPKPAWIGPKPRLRILIADTERTHDTARLSVSNSRLRLVIPSLALVQVVLISPTQPGKELIHG